MTTSAPHDYPMTTSMTTSEMRESLGYDYHDNLKRNPKTPNVCATNDDEIGSHGSHGSHSATAAAVFGMTTSMTTSGRGGHDEMTPAPADVARAHALHALAIAAQAAADERLAALRSVTSPHDREYLQAYARTCQGIADRLRNSPGYRHD